jgi:hypothetical protein
MKQGMYVINNETFGRPLLVLQIAGCQFTTDLRSCSKLMRKLPTDFLMLLAYQEGESKLRIMLDCLVLT